MGSSQPRQLGGGGGEGRGGSFGGPGLAEPVRWWSRSRTLLIIVERG